MSRYVILDENSVKKYAVEIVKFFPNVENLTCKEIGDGNLNNVYRVIDQKTNKSLIVKQALPYARTSKEMELTAERCKIEAMALTEAGKYAKEMAPDVYHYDDDLCTMAMEDLSEYTILRTAMMKQEEFPKLAEHASIYFANMLIRTSDIVLNTKQKKDEVSRFKNKDLCELTEELVFTQPTYNCKRNRVDEHLVEFIKRNVYEHKELALEFAKLKYKFMTCAQALLHGDAHSGSIFVTTDKTKFFDTEFAFYGPMGFDIGMFLANLMMDSCYQEVNFHYVYNKKVIKTISDFIDNFKVQFIKVWNEYANEYFSKKIGTEFQKWYLDEVLKDIAGYCGCEMIRRTVGSSHVKELDEYDSVELQKRAQIKNVNMAIDLILNSEKFKTGEDYEKLMNF